MHGRPRSHARASPATHARPATHCVASWWRQLRSSGTFVLELVPYTLFYAAVIVDLFIIILTVTLREIAAVFVILGCCEFRNKMYKYSCWVSLFLYFCAPVFCYCFVNCKCSHWVYITHGWHTFRYDATGKIITIWLYRCTWGEYTYDAVCANPKLWLRYVDGTYVIIKTDQLAASAVPYLRFSSGCVTTQKRLKWVSVDGIQILK